MDEFEATIEVVEAITTEIAKSTHGITGGQICALFGLDRSNMVPSYEAAGVLIHGMTLDPAMENTLMFTIGMASGRKLGIRETRA